MTKSGTRLNAHERRELWGRWKQGQTLAEIGAALERRKSTIYTVLQRAGGVAPRERCRADSHLTAQEREEISRGVVAGESVRGIARQLGRSPSTISREIARNGGRHTYRAAQAEHRARRQAKRPKQSLLASNEPLRRSVAQKLQANWSPQQIAGWLRQVHPDEPTMQISHETIYRSLFIQAKGVLKKELIGHLRSGRAIRRGKTATSKGRSLGQIVDAISIRERPAEAQDRAVPGHWEGDLICGSKNSYIATLVERHSRFAMLVKLDNRETVTVVNALTHLVQRLPEGLMTTLTWDRGNELAAHKRFTVATDVQVYFCDPRSPWQRGTNENTNGLLRQYFPKGIDLSVFTQDQLDAVADQLNTRPRKTLGFKTPADTLALALLR